MTAARSSLRLTGLSYSLTGWIDRQVHVHLDMHTKVILHISNITSTTAKAPLITCHKIAILYSSQSTVMISCLDSSCSK